MTERLSHELASLLAEDDGCLDRGEARGVLRARLARNISDGLAQGPGKHPGGEAGTIEPALIAAYLDCSVSRAERQAVVAKLAADPVLRSEVASAVLLLEGADARPAAVSVELVARAVAILAAAQPVGPRASAVWRAPIAIWSRRPAAWSGLAAVLVAAALTPAIVSMVRERTEAPGLRDVKGGTDRGVTPLPAGKGKERDSRSCDPSVERSVDGAVKTPDRPDDPSSAAPDDDPCRPKPAVEDDHKSRRP